MMSSKLTAGDLQVVTRIAVFRGLRSETVEHIIAPATAVMLRPREWLVRQEDPATAFFIVIDGWVKLYRSTPSADETPSIHCPACTASGFRLNITASKH